jgi:hypothetical protein
MRFVGGIYVVQFVMMALVRAPIRTIGPEGTLAQASAGNPLANFLVDTWVTLGLVEGAIGVGLLVASRMPGKAIALIWTVIGVELSAGIVNDTYMIARGYNLTVFVTWIVIHTVVILTGLLFLRKAGSTQGATQTLRPTT